jgi:hypothetical protein
MGITHLEYRGYFEALYPAKKNPLGGHLKKV